MFNFFRKKAQPASITMQPPEPYETDSVFCIFTPQIPSLEQARTRLESSEGEVRLVEADIDGPSLFYEVEFRQRRYRGVIYHNSEKIDTAFLQVDQLFDEEKQALDLESDTLTLGLTFGPDALLSYHLQIKIAAILCPDMTAVFDANAIRILSGRGVLLTAATYEQPSPTYLFTMHAVNAEKSGEVWLHTHGLLRCHAPEIEVLQATRETAYNYSQFLSHMAQRLIEEAGKALADAGSAPLEDDAGELRYKLLQEEIVLAQIASGEVLVGVMKPWPEALADYPGLSLGTVASREHHNGVIGTLYARVVTFRGEGEPDVSDPQKLTELYDLLGDGNITYHLSNAETDRMASLARERISFLQKGLALREAYPDAGLDVLAKIGLYAPDENGQPDPEHREHCWFDVHSVSDGQITGRLLHDTFSIEGVKEGDVLTYPVELLTDWSVAGVEPSTAHLVDLLSQRLKEHAG